MYLKLMSHFIHELEVIVYYLTATRNGTGMINDTFKNILILLNALYLYLK